MAGDLEQLLHVEMLRDLGLSCLEKRRLRGDPIECMGDTWIGPGSFQQRPVTARSNWHKQEHRKFHTNMRKNFFPVGLTEHGNGLCREVVESPSVGILETCMDAFLCGLLQGAAWQGLDSMTFRGPSQPLHFCDEPPQRFNNHFKVRQGEGLEI